MSSNINTEELVTAAELESINVEESEAINYEVVADNMDENIKNCNSQGDSKASEKLAVFPVSRIKSIMKTDPDVTIISQESAMLIAKATELFVEYLAKEVSSNMVKTKRKTVLKKDFGTIDVG